MCSSRVSALECHDPVRRRSRVPALGKNCYGGAMTIDARTLASGDGWYLRDVTCTAGPHDRPFEERHDAVCVAAVTHGTFQYRTSQGRATLAPGALLLGNPGAHF